MMIIKFKMFEDIESKKLGIFVISNSIYASNKIQNFFTNNIGTIIDYDYGSNLYKVYYEDVPNNVMLNEDDKGINFWWFSLDEILYESKDKNDLEMILATNKYNI